MRRFFVDMKAKKIDNINMDILSMGRSGDYVQAIEEGANLSASALRCLVRGSIKKPGGL